eukprot:4257616-Prymnesium_polylepis.1
MAAPRRSREASKNTTAIPRFDAHRRTILQSTPRSGQRHPARACALLACQRTGTRTQASSERPSTVPVAQRPSTHTHSARRPTATVSYTQPTTYKMSDEEVAALVVDNGSG